MLAGLLLFCVPSRRRRLLIMTSSLLIALTMGTVGCGAGLTIVTTPPLDTSATTPGIYEFTVTGTDTVDPSVTTSAVVSVNVE